MQALKGGDKVEARFAGGKTSICRVVEVEGDTVYITSERRYQEAIERDREAEALIGLPAGDVLRLD